MKTILVYEPEAIVSLDLITILKEFNVIRSTTISSLIKQIRVKKYDLIIINVSRIEGWTHLTRFLRRCNVPVVLLSTYDRGFFKNILRKDDILVEFPYDADDIINAVESYHLFE